MSFRVSSLLAGIVSATLLCGCNFGSPWGSNSSGADYGNAAGSTGTGTGGTGGGTSGGSKSPPGGVGGERGVTGTDDSIVATVSVGGPVSVKTGASQTVTVTFTSSDGLPITGFGITGATLGALPAGWSGPASFTCALVQAGSNCVLTLTYAPTAIDSGTLTLNYVFVDNAQLARTPSGAVVIPYAATAANHVLALASPAGEVNAAVNGAARTLSVNFTTDDGFAATNLSLGSSLSSLPAGWSTSSPTFGCAIVSTGSGCQLTLEFAPGSSVRGTLSLAYTYVDETGATQNGAIEVPYSTNGTSEVSATANPTGQVEAVLKTAGTPVTVTFNADTGSTGALSVSGLATLPAGWSSASKSFNCATVAAGGAGCALHLTYAPTALASGVLTLPYQYQGANGTQDGLAQIAYTATTNDSVLATPAPTGQIDAVVGLPGSDSRTVLVTFQTNDAEPATALAVTNLATLPAGWSAAGPSFACAGLAAGSACQLALTYTPTAAASGTLTLDYGYTNDAGLARNATLNIPYRATTNDTISGTPNPATLSVTLPAGAQPVTIDFATSDGNPASMLAVTSGLSLLPPGWSGPASFTCPSVSAGTPCQLVLSYAPTSATAGTQLLTLGFSYVNDAGLTGTGNVTVQYAAN